MCSRDSTEETLKKRLPRRASLTESFPTQQLNKVVSKETNAKKCVMLL